jgi:hypothetical protein
MGEDEVFAMVITMAVEQKTGGGKGFCHGDTMAVSKTRF